MSEPLTTTIRQLSARIDEQVEAFPNVFIHRVPVEALAAQAAALDAQGPEGKSLFGLPFVVKDNIDVAGMPTTAGCPAYAYVPSETAPVVQRLLDAGALLVGKTNMDQFATGLVGTRSPYGPCRSVFNGEYVSGGSSSGSAVAVAAGWAAFSLGTDTAGSGRVPAAFNGLVGLKPTRGRLSTRGVVPACRSLDCVSVFARSCDAAARVLAVAQGFDEHDPYSRALPNSPDGADGRDMPPRFRFGVPRDEQLEFFGDDGSARLYRDAIARLEAIGGEAVTIDFEPFRAVAGLLYGGAWVAERYAAVGAFLDANPSAVHPVVRSIIGGAKRLTAADAFNGMTELQRRRRRCDRAWHDIDLLALPTTGTTYRVNEVLAEPEALNSRLGYYTNFVNLLDLAGLALPAGHRANATGFGITLTAPAFSDDALLRVGAAFEARYREQVEPASPQPTPPRSRVRLAVVGAHLSGEPLNHQLTGRGAELVWSGRTAPAYRLYAMTGARPPKPALVHVGDGGAAIEVEVWALDVDAFGSFIAEVPPPLAIGTVELATGEQVKGFVCEPRAVESADDITSFGGWRAYRAAGVGA